MTDEGYVGMDVHRAARIAASAHGGQIVVSEATRRLLDGRPRLRDLGEHRLKDLIGAERLFQLGEATSRRSGRSTPPTSPVVSIPLVGREQELDELVAMLSNGTRLLTVTGPGGTGKTRLALQVAAELAGRLEDGVFWVHSRGSRTPSSCPPRSRRRSAPATTSPASSGGGSCCSCSTTSSTCSTPRPP